MCKLDREQLKILAEAVADSIGDPTSNEKPGVIIDNLIDTAIFPKDHGLWRVRGVSEITIRDGTRYDFGVRMWLTCSPWGRINLNSEVTIIHKRHYCSLVVTLCFTRCHFGQEQEEMEAKITKLYVEEGRSFTQSLVTWAKENNVNIETEVDIE